MDVIDELNHSRKSLNTGKFYLVNGWGIISFKSDIEFTSSRNAIKFPKNVFGDKSVSNLIEELNKAVSPILEKHYKLCQEELKKEILKEN